MQIVALIVSVYVVVCTAQNDSGSGMSDAVTIINTATIPSMVLPTTTNILAPSPSPIIQVQYVSSGQFVGMLLTLHYVTMETI